MKFSFKYWCSFQQLNYLLSSLFIFSMFMAEFCSVSKPRRQAIGCTPVTNGGESTLSHQQSIISGTRRRPPRRARARGEIISKTWPRRERSRTGSRSQRRGGSARLWSRGSTRPSAADSSCTNSTNSLKVNKCLLY